MGWGGGYFKEGSQEWLLRKVEDKKQRKQWRNCTIATDKLADFVRKRLPVGLPEAMWPKRLLLTITLPHISKGQYGDAAFGNWHQCAAVCDFERKLMMFYNPWDVEDAGPTRPLPGIAEEIAFELGMEAVVQVRGGQADEEDDTWCFLYAAQFLHRVLHRRGTVQDRHIYAEHYPKRHFSPIRKRGKMNWLRTV